VHCLQATTKSIPAVISTHAPSWPLSCAWLHCQAKQLKFKRACASFTAAEHCRVFQVLKLVHRRHADVHIRCIAVQ
jgi:hypothetical protein